MLVKKQRPKSCEISNVNSNRKKIIFWIEIVAVFTLISGICFSFLNVKNFDFSKFLETIKSSSGLKKDEAESRELTFLDKARNSIDKKLLSITELKETPEVLSIKSREGIDVFISKNKDLETQVKTLQTVLSKAKIEKREVLLVDFRFDKLT